MPPNDPYLTTEHSFDLGLVEFTKGGKPEKDPRSKGASFISFGRMGLHAGWESQPDCCYSNEFQVRESTQGYVWLHFLIQTLLGVSVPVTSWIVKRVDKKLIVTWCVSIALIG